MQRSLLFLFVAMVSIVYPLAGYTSVVLHASNLTSEPDTLQPDTGGNRKLIIESDFNSKYLWRGIALQNAITWNPNITLSCNHFSANIWSNIPIQYYDIEDKKEQDFKELDFNLNYELEKEVSYTMLTHSAQIYSPLGKGDWYWGLINLFQGFYKGDIGIYINPEINYYPFKGGMFIETGLNYNHQGEKSEVIIYLAHSTANKIFTQYNVCSTGEGIYTKPFQTLKFDMSYQYNLKSIFIRPHFSYYYLLNYNEIMGYKSSFSFGMALGLNKK